VAPGRRTRDERDQLGQRARGVLTYLRYEHRQGRLAGVSSLGKTFEESHALRHCRARDAPSLELLADAIRADLVELVDADQRLPVLLGRDAE
jgi:hypothetical protein